MKSLHDLKSLLAASTQGEWTMPKVKDIDKDIVIERPGVYVDHDDVPLEESEANAGFICAAHNRAAAMIALEECAEQYARAYHAGGYSSAECCVARQLLLDAVEALRGGQ